MTAGLAACSLNSADKSGGDALGASSGCSLASPGEVACWGGGEAGLGRKELRLARTL